MIKEPAIYLRHIVDSINSIEKYLQGVTEKQFYASEEKQDSVSRRIEIIGEATKNIADDFKKQHPDIPWKEMSAMRNILIHEYDDVDSSITWDTATQHLPPLKKQVQKMLTEQAS